MTVNAVNLQPLLACLFVYTYADVRREQVERGNNNIKYVHHDVTVAGYLAKITALVPLRAWCG